MVDSSRLPPSQVSKPASPATMLGDQSARVVRLPDALSALSRAVRVEGEVVRQNTDGSVRINTPQGDVDVQVRGRQPQPGQRLEIDIPAGRPPRQVTIRSAQAAPPQDPAATPRPAPQTPATPQAPPPLQTRPVQGSPAPTTQQPAAPPTQGQPAPAPAAPPSRPGVTPPAMPPQQASPQPAQPQPAPLPPGSAVRFLPATPAQAQQIVQSVNQMMTALPTTATRVAFAANLIAQNAQNSLTQPMLQAKPGDVTAIAQQLRGAPTLQPGVSFPSTPSASLLQQILNLPSGLIPQTQITTKATALPSGAPAVMPATGNAISSSPLATLIALTPAFDTPTLTQPASAMRIAQMDVRILSIQPPAVTLTPGAGINTPTGTPAQGLPAPAAMPNAPAGSVVAQVTGFTSQNLPLVTLVTQGGGLPQNFILQFNAGNLQVGSTITLAPQNVQIAPPGTTPGLNPAALSPRMSALLSLFGPGPWPVMDESYQTLLQTAPQAAQAFARALPSPGNPAQLGGAALLFIAAVRSGDIGGWLGDKKIDALQRGGKNNLLSRLTQDLSTLAQRTSEAPALSSDWRPVPLPLFWEGQIHKIALYVKQDGGKDASDERDGTGQTRFIFDLDLDRMGGVQLDGLVRDKRFDLVVRTQAPLSEPMRQMMKQSYTKALETTELHGDLSFQGDIKNWVNVLQKEEAFGANA